jgi:hypothetical protein
MNMLAMPGGQERTESEYRGLLDKADLSLAQILALLGTDVGLMEVIVKHLVNRDENGRAQVDDYSGNSARRKPSAYRARSSGRRNGT